jgi:hypothetical protein
MVALDAAVKAAAEAAEAAVEAAVAALELLLTKYPAEGLLSNQCMCTNWMCEPARFTTVVCFQPRRRWNTVTDAILSSKSDKTGSPCVLKFLSDASIINFSVS